LSELSETATGRRPLPPRRGKNPFLDSSFDADVPVATMVRNPVQAQHGSGHGVRFTAPGSAAVAFETGTRQPQFETGARPKQRVISNVFE
jgi:hypothetical protein